MKIEMVRMMSEKQHDDLVSQLKVTNILLAKIYGALVSTNPILSYVDQDHLQKEIKVINKIIDVFCGDVLDE